MKSLFQKSILPAAAMAVLTAAVAPAANIKFFEFSEDTDEFMPGPAEFQYSPESGLSGGLGATGNLSPFSPGLNGRISGGLPGIPTSPPAVGLGVWSNVLYDLTLDLTGFAATGDAVVGADTIQQGLGYGTFTIRYKPAAGPDLILLQGKTNSATLSMGSTGGNSSVLSGNVTYTGGVLADALVDFGMLKVGSFSFAMIVVDGTYGTESNGSYTRLARFSADGSGMFGAMVDTGGGPAVPSPAAVYSGLGLLGLLCLTRLKKRGATH